MGQGYSSNSGIFARRGNPWVSKKEGIKDFGRNPETEDPEYDFDHRYHKTGETFGKPIVAPVKTEAIEPRPVKETEADFARRKANIMLSFRRGQRERLVDVKDGQRGFDGVKPDNIPKSVAAGSKEPSREKQTPPTVGSKSHHDFSGGNPPKEVKKNGKIYRRR